MHWWGADLCRRKVLHIFGLADCKDSLTKCNMLRNLHSLSAVTLRNLAGKFPPQCTKELKWVMILNKAENESQTQVANHLFFFYYLLCVAPPTLSRRAPPRKKKRFAGAAVKIKFNKTKHAHVLLVLFVCKKKTKTKKWRSDFRGAGWGAGTATFTWRILRRNTSRPRQYCRRLFFSRLVCGALIAAIIQSLRAETPARETAHHPHILMKPQSNSWETKRAPIWLLKQTARNNSQVCGPRTPSDDLPSLSLFSHSGFNAVSRQDCCGGKWSLHWTIAIWFSSSQRQPSHRVFCPNGWLYDMKTVSSFSAVIWFAPLLLLTIKGSDHLSLSPTVNSPLIIKQGQVWEVRAKKTKTQTSHRACGNKQAPRSERHSRHFGASRSETV